MQLSYASGFAPRAHARYSEAVLQTLPRPYPKAFHCCALVLALVATTACPGRNKRNVGAPKIALPQSGSPDARARFQQSQARFERDGEIPIGQSAAEFEAIVHDFPDDPIVPHALLYAAMASYVAGDVAAGLTKLDELAATPRDGVDPTLVLRARLFRGLSLAALGRPEQALADLEAGQGALDRSSAQELGDWNGAMAEATAVTAGRLRDAMLFYDAYWQTGREVEKQYAVDRIVALHGQLGPEEQAAVVEAARAQPGPALAVVGAAYQSWLRGQGRGADADGLMSAVSSARAGVGLGTADSGLADPGRIGALLPLTGRLNRVGELSLRGLALAATSGTGQGGESFELLARDTRSQGDSVTAAVDDLARQGAIALIGPYDSRALQPAETASMRHGLPLVSLAAVATTSSGNTFYIRHTAEQRARALARRAVAEGARDFAIFAPETGYGRIVGQAFRDEVTALGGAVVVSATYPQGTTSFDKHIGALKKPWTALFVPDLARNLQLIAPALAAANLHARPRGEPTKHGRAIWLLSTAEGIDEDFLRAAGRYSWGALFAPGFFPDRTDERIADFVVRYEDEHDRAPSAHEAYAFDAALAIQEAVAAGARSRSEVAASLRAQSVEGVTGAIEFDSKGRRRDGGLLFQIDKSIGEQFELRARR